ncbi:MAG: hypothetical protein U0T74_12945 [Chitinophagales bacterium]
MISPLVKTNADTYALHEIKAETNGNTMIYSFRLPRYKNNDWKLFYKMYEIYLALNDKDNALYSISIVIEMGEKPDHYEERARLYLDKSSG